MLIWWAGGAMAVLLWTRVHTHCV